MSVHASYLKPFVTITMQDKIFMSLYAGYLKPFVIVMLQVKMFMSQVRMLMSVYKCNLFEGVCFCILQIRILMSDHGSCWKLCAFVINSPEHRVLSELL